MFPPNCAFPYHGYAPAACKQNREYFPVIFPVPPYFLLPEILPCSWQPEQGAVMPMPETAVDKNDCPVPGENDIWFSCHVLDMKPETESLPVQKLANENFWPGMGGPDFGHHPAAGFRVDYVHHADGIRRAMDMASPCSSLLLGSGLWRRISCQTESTMFFPSENFYQHDSFLPKIMDCRGLFWLVQEIPPGRWETGTERFSSRTPRPLIRWVWRRMLVRRMPAVAKTAKCSLALVTAV